MSDRSEIVMSWSVRSGRSNVLTSSPDRSIFLTRRRSAEISGHVTADRTRSQRRQPSPERHHGSKQTKSKACKGQLGD